MQRSTNLMNMGEQSSRLRCKGNSFCGRTQENGALSSETAPFVDLCQSESIILHLSRHRPRSRGDGKGFHW